MPETGNNHISQNSLSIQADLNGFSFCVYDYAGNCVSLQHYDYTITDYNDLDDKIHAIFRRDSRLKQPYKKCSCLFLSEKSTLIPGALFNAQHLRTYLDFVAPLDDLDEIHFRQINTPNAMAIFAIPSPFAAAVNMYQPNVVFYHQCIPVIQLLQEQQAHNGVLLHLNANLASVALCAGGRMTLYNTFHVQAFTDVLYYVSFLLRQWQLLPQNTNIYLTGCLQDEDESLFRNYFSSVKKMQSSAISHAFGAGAGTKYQLLYSINACES